MYAIKIDNRYISWCDESWYGTSPIPLYLFDVHEAHRIMSYYLPKHRVYKSELYKEDKFIEDFNLFRNYL